MHFCNVTICYELNMIIRYTKVLINIFFLYTTVSARIHIWYFCHHHHHYSIWFLSKLLSLPSKPNTCTHSKIRDILYFSCCVVQLLQVSQIQKVWNMSKNSTFFIPIIHVGYSCLDLEKFRNSSKYLLWVILIHIQIPPTLFQTHKDKQFSNKSLFSGHATLHRKP